jgi:hypothetical protein
MSEQPISAQQLMQFAAYLEHDFDETVAALVKDFGMDETAAKEGLRSAFRERQEIDIADTHDEVLREDD